MCQRGYSNLCLMASLGAVSLPARTIHRAFGLQYFLISFWWDLHPLNRDMIPCWRAVRISSYMYIPCLVFFNPTLRICIAFVCSSSPPIFCDNLDMPLGSKQSRTAKQRRHGAHKLFTRHATSPQGEESSGSEYCITNDSSDASEIDVEHNNDIEGDEEAATSVEALQHLYAVFLPPHLHLKAVAKTREKRRKIST